jgi:hypothetical protein
VSEEVLDPRLVAVHSAATADEVLDFAYENATLALGALPRTDTSFSDEQRSAAPAPFSISSSSAERWQRAPLWRQWLRGKTGRRAAATAERGRAARSAPAPALASPHPPASWTARRSAHVGPACSKPSGCRGAVGRKRLRREPHSSRLRLPSPLRRTVRGRHADSSRRVCHITRRRAGAERLELQHSRTIRFVRSSSSPAGGAGRRPPAACLQPRLAAAAGHCDEDCGGPRKRAGVGGGRRCGRRARGAGGGASLLPPARDVFAAD